MNPIIIYSLIQAVAVCVMLLGMFFLGFKAGDRKRVNQAKQVYKKRENGSVNDFVLGPAEDGAMEILLTKKAYKKLRSEPIMGPIEGSKDTMLFRVRVR